jgi:hypothetical protein
MSRSFSCVRTVHRSIYAADAERPRRRGCGRPDISSLRPLAKVCLPLCCWLGRRSASAPSLSVQDKRPHRLPSTPLPPIYPSPSPHLFYSHSRGDVVVATSPQNPKTTVCKRIIGLPGDRVCINPTKYPRKFKTVCCRVLGLLKKSLQNMASRGFQECAMVFKRRSILPPPSGPAEPRLPPRG